MRNIWPVIVGVVVVAGAGVAVYNAVADKNAAPRPEAAVPASQQTADASGAPKPKASFGKIEITADDYVLGRADAPVTVVEYASLTCPHCARFHTDVLPTIKKDFVDAGQVRFVYRDFPLDNSALMAAVVARCAGRDRYFAFLDALFASQDNWARSSDPAAALSRVALLGGLSESDVNACMKNESLVNSVVKERLEGDKKYGVNSTPTLIVNGEKYGAMSIEQFRAVVAPKLK